MTVYCVTGHVINIFFKFTLREHQRGRHIFDRLLGADQNMLKKTHKVKYNF